MNTYIQKSFIHGNGLFSSLEFKTGDVVVDYRNIGGWYKVNVDFLNDYQINHNWLIMQDDGLCETTDNLGELNIMNHSRTPNCSWHIKEKYITAARDINVDEELTIDYRLEERSNRVSFPDWI